MSECAGLDKLNLEPADIVQKRGWFQLHLSTAIGLMLLASLAVGLDVAVYTASDNNRPSVIALAALECLLVLTLAKSFRKHEEPAHREWT